MNYRTANRRAGRASDFLRKRGQKTGNAPMALPVTRKPVNNHSKGRANLPAAAVPAEGQLLRGEACYPNGRSR